MNRFIFPIKKYDIDENISFSYMRSFITFYYYVILEKKFNKITEIKKEFKKIYGNLKYFDFFYETFVIDKNPLIFTYFNNIPLHFYPYIDELYFFYPTISFYNNKNKFYKLGNINFNDKLNFYFIKQESFKISNKEVQITIPIKYFNKTILKKNNLILLKVNSDYIITKKIIFKNNSDIEIKEFFLKNNKIKRYKFFKVNLYFNLSDIDYICVLNKITKKLFNKIYKFDILKKNRILYNYQTNFKSGFEGLWFSFLYPKISPFKYEKDINLYCRRTKLIKDLKVLNLNIDIFYNNEIIKDLIKKKYKYIKPSKEYNKYEYDEIYRCINSAENLKNRLNICNFNKKNFDYLESDSWSIFYKDGKLRQNKGKDTLHLLIFKNKALRTEDFRYNYFLRNYDVYTFIYNYGYYFYENKKKFYDTELYFDKHNLDINEYFKLIDIKKGYCTDMYKKSLLLAEKLMVED